MGAMVWGVCGEVLLGFGRGDERTMEEELEYGF